VFTGFREDVPRLMAAFDVFAMSSLHEGLSIALLEAMSLGVPPVVTRVGGTPEVVGADEGFVVEPADPAALAKHIIALVRDPNLRHSLGEGARRRAATFDVANTVARTEEVYEEVLT
jgi:glycosyltransferase involved in cell wall biosynthesis